MLHQIIQKKEIDPQNAEDADRVWLESLDQIIQGTHPNHPIILKFLLKGELQNSLHLPRVGDGNKRRSSAEEEILRFQHQANTGTQGKEGPHVPYSDGRILLRG